MADKHSAAQLSEGLEHVVYEIWKYKQSVADYAQIRQIGSDAAIEFRVLHHRVLLEFFYGPRAHEDNLLACEYIADWLHRHERTGIPWLRDYMRRCHAMLAHISTERIEIAKRGLKDWAQEWQTVEPHLDQLVNDFLARLSDEHKTVCLRWIDGWLRMPAGKVLAGLSPAFGRPSR